jgi:hypothetical protein
MMLLLMPVRKLKKADFSVGTRPRFGADDVKVIELLVG